MSDYTDLTTVKAWLKITAATDDTLLTGLITRASGIIDEYTARYFEAQTLTRYFDAVGPHIDARMLFVDQDLLTVTGLVNGDGSAITSGQYVLRPSNSPPYYGIALKSNAGVSWTYTGDPEEAISVTGTWGYSATPPGNVVQAAIRLTAWLYRQRDTNDQGDRVVTSPAAGTTIYPARLPQDIRDLLAPYLKMNIGAAGDWL